MMSLTAKLLALTLARVLILASLAAAAPPDGVQVPAGYRAEVLAVGLSQPIDLALAPDGDLLVLNHLGREGAASEIVRIPLPAPAIPLAAADLPRTPIPFGPGRQQYRMGALTIHPRSGQVVLSELYGQRVVLVPPGGPAGPYAVGFRYLARGAVRFDGGGHLWILVTGAGAAAGSADPMDQAREWFPDQEEEGPMLYRVSLADRVPLPRDARYWRPIFPRGEPDRRVLKGLDRPDVLAAAPGGELYLGTLTSGEVYKVSEAGGLSAMGRIPRGRHRLAVSPAGDLFLSHWLSRTIFRMSPDGSLTTFATGLSSPAGIAVDRDGTLYVAESEANRVLRIAPE